MTDVHLDPQSMESGGVEKLRQEILACSVTSNHSNAQRIGATGREELEQENRPDNATSDVPVIAQLTTTKSAEDLQSDHSAQSTAIPARRIKGLRWILIVIAVLSSAFLFALDTTIVADVQPGIIATFGEIYKLPWISVAFSLGTVCANLLW